MSDPGRAARNVCFGSVNMARLHGDFDNTPSAAGGYRMRVSGALNLVPGSIGWDRHNPPNSLQGVPIIDRSIRLLGCAAALVSDPNLFIGGGLSSASRSASTSSTAFTTPGGGPFLGPSLSIAHFPSLRSLSCRQRSTFSSPFLVHCL